MPPKVEIKSGSSFIKNPVVDQSHLRKWPRTESLKWPKKIVLVDGAINDPKQIGKPQSSTTCKHQKDYNKSKAKKKKRKWKKESEEKALSPFSKHKSSILYRS